MTDGASSILDSVGHTLEHRFITELDAKPLAEFSELLDLRDAEGHRTGYVKVFGADGLTKGSSISINIGPVGRYFNIHLIPDHHYDVPRFVFEGMLTAQGSQLSTDLFPDTDLQLHFGDYLQQHARVADIYKDAVKSESLNFVPSRQPQMRAFCSPFFMLVFGAQEDQIPEFEGYAHRYFSEWLEMFREAPEVSKTEAALRLKRRTQMAKTLIELDPDRPMVVQFFGEETTREIERATMT